MKRFSKSHLILLSLLFGALAVSAYGDSVSSTNVNQLQRIISGERGRPAVVVLFSSGCKLSKKLWPGLLNFAEQSRDKNLGFLIFSTDRKKKTTERFISDVNLPFNCYWIKPWAPGHLDASMKPMDIKVGKTFLRPLVAVIDANGKVVAQWQGLTNISNLLQISFLYFWACKLVSPDE